MTPPFRQVRSAAFAVAAAFLAVASGTPARAQMSASELIVRLDRLEGQVRQLTGTVEQLQFRNQQLEQQLKRSQEDVEFRFGELGGGRGGAGAGPASRPRPQPGLPPAAGQPMPPPQGQGAPPNYPAPNQPPSNRRSDIEEPPYDAPRSSQSARRSDVFDPEDEPDAPGVPRPLGSMAAGRGGPPPGSIMQDEAPPPGQRGRGSRPMDLGSLSDRIARDPQYEPPGQPYPSQPSGASPQIATGPTTEPRTIQGALPPPPPRNPNATGAGPGPQVAAAPSGAAATPRDAFDVAYGHVQRRDFANAETGMREFLQKYPNDRMVSDANYWLGESLYQRQRFRDAAEAFLTVSTKFENSGKAPDSLLRLGQSLAALKEREAACATLGEVMRKYPRASANVKQGVEREQKRAGC